MSEYDAIVVGGNIAGSATAALLGRYGLKVALLEKSPDPSHYKHLCTHEIVALANPVLERLGIFERLREIGGPHRSPDLWTRYGWVAPDPTPEPEQGINVRREVLDPMVRDVAAGTPGVELRLGALVTDVTRSADGRPVGVRVRERGVERELRGRIIVGADGQHSPVAKMTGVAARIKPHERFGYAGYFEGVVPGHGDAVTSKFWLLDPDVAYIFPTDGGLTLLAVAPYRTPERVAAFKADLDGEFRRVYDGLPDGPDLSRARQVGKYRGLVATRNSRRPPSAPGLAFVGDAAQVTDFVWGTGCGFALASADLLADAVGPALAGAGSDADVDKALRVYRRRHFWAIGTHYLQTSSYSTGRPFTPPERALFRAGVRDETVAEAVHVMGSRVRPPHRVVTPTVLARAAVAAIGRSATGTVPPRAGGDTAARRARSGYAGTPS